MAPKAKAAKTVDKAKQAAKQKVVEDKTFGLKNKNKSSKVQKFVQQVQQSVQPKGKPEVSKKDKKKQEEEQAKELAALFAMAIKQPKVPAGVDPKSIVCEYFRHGQCTKGFKCKYSHDLSVERKGGKADLYTDKRSAGEEEQREGMEDWDQETLEKAIAQKHAAENKNRPTEIVCKYFIDAVEKKQYGWFWQCPNGKECKYRHALPPGYVLKSQMKQLLEEEAANSKSVEEIIEEERSKVDAKTPITDEVFEKWKAEQVAAQRKEDEAKEEERRKKGIMTGREIFAQEGFIATDDASASDAYTREVDEEAEIKRMHKEAEEALAQARAQAAAAPPAAEPAGADGDGGAAAPAAVLTAEEEEDLFDDDDDDDEVLEALTGDLAKPGTLEEGAS